MSAATRLWLNLPQLWWNWGSKRSPPLQGEFQLPAQGLHSLVFHNDDVAAIQRQITPTFGITQVSGVFPPLIRSLTKPRACSERIALPKSGSRTLSLTSDRNRRRKYLICARVSERQLFAEFADNKRHSSPPKPIPIAKIVQIRRYQALAFVTRKS